MKTSLFLFAADFLSGAMAGSDRMARRTAAVGGFGYGGDFSPAPTPGPALFGRVPELAARSLKPDTCGIVTMDSRTFAVTCPNAACQTQNNFMGCNKQPFSKCYLGSAAICKGTALGPGVLCCTRTANGWIAKCLTYSKDATRADWKSRLTCAHSSLDGRTALTMIAATAESAFFGSGGTVTQTDPMPTESSPVETNSPSGGGSSNNTGAIVGGVVGGVAVVAIAACVIVWMLVRRRRGAKKETPPASTPGQDSYMTGQPYVPSLTPQQHYAGNEEQYKYQPVPPGVPPGVPPPPVIHEAPAESPPAPQTFRAELEDRPRDRV